MVAVGDVAVEVGQILRGVAIDIVVDILCQRNQLVERPCAGEDLVVGQLQLVFLELALVDVVHLAGL